MIPVVTTEQMRAIDQAAIAGEELVGFGYMLKAAMGLFSAVRTIQPDPADGDIAVVCGKGNNGGDGYVAAGLLLDAGYRVMVFGLYGRDALSGEALLAFNEYDMRKGNFLLLEDTEELAQLTRYSVVVDAILGTGLTGNPRGRAAKAIDAVNAAGRPVIAADTPSGLDNDTGHPGAPCIRAHTTVTMGFPKLGALFYPGRTCIGTLWIQDLGYPDDIVADHHDDVLLPNRTSLTAFLPPRNPAGSKANHGQALLVSGARGMCGSAALACNSAMRTGCGMVHAAVAQGAVDVLAAMVTEPVLHACPQTAAGSLALQALESVAAVAERTQAACIGPGLSHHPDTTALVRALLGRLSQPIVLDADGINAFRDDPSGLAEHTGPLVITPHAGEFARVFGPLPDAPEPRVQRVRSAARDTNTVILLKGAPTIVATPDGDTYIMPVGNSGMATAGSGDVLSGIIVSLMAQGASPVDASLLGCMLHALAGDLAADTHGEYGMVASDMVAALPTVLTRICNFRSPEALLPL